MTTPSPVQQNRFRDCADVPELVGQTVGAGSSPQLWLSEPGGDEAQWYPIGKEDRAKALPAVNDSYGRSCVFQDQDAKAVAEESLAQLRNLLIGKILAQGYTAEHAVAQADYLLAE